GDGAGDRVGEVAVPVVLVDRLRGGVGHTGRADRVGRGRGRAAGEVLIGRPGPGRRAAGADLHAGRRRRRRGRGHLAGRGRRSATVCPGDVVLVRGAVGQPGVGVAGRPGR